MFVPTSRDCRAAILAWSARAVFAMLVQIVLKFLDVRGLFVGTSFPSLSFLTVPGGVTIFKRSFMFFSSKGLRVPSAFST